MKRKETYANHAVCCMFVALIVIAATGVCGILASVGIENESLIMVYIIGVLLSTLVSRGYLYGFITAVLSLMTYNYFFAYPYFTMMIYYKRDMVMMCFFFVTAIIGGGMSSKYKLQTTKAMENERTSRLMYEITETFAGLAGAENIISAAEKFISEMTGYHCSVKISCGENVQAVEGKYCLSFSGNSGIAGNVIIDVSPEMISQDDEKIIKAVANQTALVLDREEVYSEREKYKLDVEAERLKSTLLRSISHDIRTPLTGILGASTTMVENSDSMNKDDMADLAKDIMEDAGWLIMTVQNILNLTRLSDGAFDLRREIESVDDLISQAIGRISKVYSGGTVSLSSQIPENLIFVNVDGQLMVQVLVNLLDNAFRHSDGAENVILKAYEDDKNVIFEVSDDGGGIDENIINSIFDGFVTRSSHSSDKGRGMGLGLSICKEIVNAHGGHIEAENTKNGAVFRVRLPKEDI